MIGRIIRLLKGEYSSDGLGFAKAEWNGLELTLWSDRTGKLDPFEESAFKESKIKRCLAKVNKRLRKRNCAPFVLTLGEPAGDAEGKIL